MDFEEIYKTYFTDVFRYIRRLSGNEQIAEEITAETFFKALQSLDRFRGDCDLRVWLCQIAKNCYLSHLKKAGKYTGMDDADLLLLADPGEGIEEKLMRKEDAALLQRILHDIPEPYKEVFMWRVFAELSFRQIGQLFGKSENWACVTYHRARSKIIKRMEEQTYEK